MAESPTPHDHLFQALLEDPHRAGILLREQLPAEVAERMTDAPPQLEEGSFVDDELRPTRSDRLFTAGLKDGRSAFFYVLLEHKSEPDPRTPIQLLGYMSRIWERYAGQDRERLRHLPPIMPLVIYHGRQPWNVAQSVLDCIDADPVILALQQDFRYAVQPLRDQPYEALSADPAVRSALGALAHVFDREVDAATLARIFRDAPDWDTLEHRILAYIAQTFPTTQEAFDAALTQSKPERREDLTMTVAEEWRQEGKQEGEATMLIRLVERRFGEGAADPYRGQIEAADAQTLLRWFDQGLSAQTLNEVFQ